jgi:3-methyladenine DNA glycosylase Tag
MSDEALRGAARRPALIRRWGKLKSVRDNAAAMMDVAEEQAALARGLPTAVDQLSSRGRRSPTL